MATITITRVNNGIKILSDTSSFVLNEYSTKRSNLNNNKFTIISDIKDNYAEYEINFSTDTVTFNGNTVLDAETLEAYLSSTSQQFDVTIQDQTTPSIEHFMWQDINDITILSNMTKGDNVITLVSGHGIVNDSGDDRDYINIYYSDSNIIGDFVNNRFSQHAVVGISGDNISITPPIPYDLDTTKVTSSQRVNVNMAKLASFASPLTFKAYPPTNLSWDLTRIVVDKIMTSAGEDALFGNLPALQNGLFFGFEGDNFTEYQLMIFDNGGWRATAYDVQYTTRSTGGGLYGMAIRKTSAGQDKLGVAIRLDSSTNDIFICKIQDDLSLLNRFRIKVMGHIVN